ncbi:MAG: Lrp/AsnC ligand binding domain-containing protein [Nitrososphaera sp.]|jgi:DNA-binding Lrp family transcriptional regulator
MISSLVLANCFLFQDDSIQAALQKINGVQQVFRTLGVYDLVIRVQAEDEDKLKQVVKKIKGIDGIQSVLTNIIHKPEDATSVSTDAV